MVSGLDFLEILRCTDDQQHCVCLAAGVHSLDRGAASCRDSGVYSRLYYFNAPFTKCTLYPMRWSLAFCNTSWLSAAKRAHQAWTRKQDWVQLQLTNAEHCFSKFGTDVWLCAMQMSYHWVPPYTQDCLLTELYCFISAACEHFSSHMNAWSALVNSHKCPQWHKHEQCWGHNWWSIVALPMSLQYSQSLLDNLDWSRLMDTVTQTCNSLAACAASLDTLDLPATGQLTTSVNSPHYIKTIYHTTHRRKQLMCSKKSDWSRLCLVPERRINGVGKRSQLAL